MYEPVTGTFRTPGGRIATMHYRSDTNDYNTLFASMNEDEYRLRERSFSGLVLDIGGYLGSVGIGIALDNPEAVVTIVEPVPPNAALIRENIAQNGLEGRVTLIEGAAGGPDPVTVWYGYRGSPTAEHHAFVGNSSIAYDHGGELDHDEVVYDEPVSLASLVGDGASVLKIDCEGAEWEILTDPSVALIDLIVGESHSVRGHKGRDIIELLAATHDVTLSGDPDGTCEFEAVRR